MIARAAALLLLSTSLWAQSYNIATAFGGGVPMLPAPASGVSIGYCYGMAMDGSGNLYISDETINVVFKVTKSGTTTIFAGTHFPGYSGDGGPATNAMLNDPEGLAFDTAGDLLIIDAANYVIRKVTPSGIITTIAGNGSYGYSGDGGPATQASLSYTESLAVDSSGNVYVADTDNSVIRMISQGGIITTFAGTGSRGYSGDGGPASAAQLRYPRGVALDASGNLYIADSNNFVIRKVNTSGVISTIAGNASNGFSGDGGPALSAQLSYPESLALDANGNIYIADSNNSVIREVLVTGTITTVAGTGVYGYSGDGGTATNAILNYPSIVISAPNGALLIADADNARVRNVSALGVITTFAGNGSLNFAGDNGDASSALLAEPNSISIGIDGSVYIADSGNSRIRKVSPSGVITTIAGNGSSGYSGDNGPAALAALSYPSGVAVNAAGSVYIADTYNSVVRKISSSGTITTVAGTGNYGYSGDGGAATSATLDYPNAIALDTAGNVYIADSGNSAIREITVTGVILTVAGNGNRGYSGDNGPATSAQLAYPSGLTFDSSGNLYIADEGNRVIRKIDAMGVITSITATRGAVGYPVSVAVDRAGTLYVSDPSDSVIDAISTTGVLNVIAGGVFGYSGDGGPAIGSAMAYPLGLAVSPSGTIYVADFFNNAVRSLTMCSVGVPTSAAADSASQTLNLPITADPSCNWAATGLPSWISSASSGVGAGMLALTLQANTTGVDQSAAITVNGVQVAISQAFTPSTFTDVVPGTYYFDAVNLLQGKSIVDGCGTDVYCPGAAVTRDDIAVMLVRTVLGTGSFTYSTTPYFADVPSGYPAFPWIQKLYELGITSGCSAVPMNYCPASTVTRDEMAILLIRARYGPATAFTWNPVALFGDVPATYYAFDWVQRMYRDSITAGCGGASLNYCPEDLVTRGDMALFLMRAGFNQLLPLSEPLISSIAPTTLARGTTGTFTITGTNTSFQQGLTTLVFPANAGITVDSIAVVNPTSMLVTLSAGSSAPAQPLSIYEQSEPEESVLPNGLLVQ